MGNEIDRTPDDVLHSTADVVMVTADVCKDEVRDGTIVEDEEIDTELAGAEFSLTERPCTLLIHLSHLRFQLIVETPPSNNMSDSDKSVAFSPGIFCLPPKRGYTILLILLWCELTVPFVIAIPLVLQPQPTPSPLRGFSSYQSGDFAMPKGTPPNVASECVILECRHLIRKTLGSQLFQRPRSYRSLPRYRQVHFGKSLESVC
jgi:hypothetical protein